MKHQRLVFLSLAVFVIAQLAALPAAACEKGTCEVDRTCEKTDTGMRCTIKAKGDTGVDTVRSCVRAAAGSHQMEGVSVTFEEIDGGIVVVRSADDPETVKQLQEQAAGCAKGHHCCCAGARGGHDCPHHAAQTEPAHQPCAKPCPRPCSH